MCEQGIEVMHDFQRLFMRIADVYAHMTDYACRTGDEQVGPGDGGPQGGSRERRAARTIETRILVRAHLSRILDVCSRLPSSPGNGFSAGRTSSQRQSPQAEFQGSQPGPRLGPGVGRRKIVGTVPARRIQD